MPQPKFGRMTRSPLEVPSTIQIDSLTLSSYSESFIEPSGLRRSLPPASASGSGQPTPRKGLDKSSRPPLFSPDKNRPDCYDFSGGQVCRIVARHRSVAIARRHLPVDLHRGASYLNRRFVRRRLLKG